MCSESNPFPSGDDPTYLTELADTVDRALGEYDIDLRGCLASTMCHQLEARSANAATPKSDSGDEEDSSSITGMLGYGLVKTAAR